MVKLYQKYECASTFGLINTPQSNVLTLGPKTYTAQLENVGVWNSRTGALVMTWKDPENTSEVVLLAASPDGTRIASGHVDGSIRLWDVDAQSLVTVFEGHRSAVVSMAFTPDGAMLASGSRDTTIVIWDLVELRGSHRLRGHRDAVTQVLFLPAITVSDHPDLLAQPGLGNLADLGDAAVLLSASKDSLIKIWDLNTQHCVDTTMAHQPDVSAMLWVPELNALLTSGGDATLKVWNVAVGPLLVRVQNPETGDPAASTLAPVTTVAALADTPAQTLLQTPVLSLLGQIEHAIGDRITGITLAPDAVPALIVHGYDKTIQLFRIISEDDLKRKLKRRMKRRREKRAQATGGSQPDAAADAEPEPEPVVTALDRLTRWGQFRTTGKIRSVSHANVLHPSDGAFLLTVALTTNALEVYRVDTRTTSADEFATLAHRNALPGHRSDVRAVALSTTEDLILSTSQDEAKVWNRRTQTCVSSFSAASGLGVCCMFVPGNKMFLVGTKQGTLELFDIASNQHVWSLPAHEGAVWSMQMTNDRTGFVTGSADKTVKFWEFALEEVPLMDSSDIAGVELAGPMPTRRMLSVNHTRTLKMTEEVLAVALSPDDQFLAVSLLDSTVKVFYLDSLKFFLSLYGHKLPVLSMAIASDSTIIATASADKTIKLWGLDFGDCHRSWNAHNESVISIAFVWGTHYLFSAGKDGVLKYWDGDHGVLLQALPGHQSELWCLAVGKYGNTVVTGSKDRSLRIWSKTEDLFVPEEERDDQLERMHDLEMTARADRFANTGGIGSGVTPDDAAATGALVSADAAALAERGDATKKTLEALRATDRILEALEVWATDRPALDAYERALAVAASSSSSSSAPAKPTPSPYIMALGLRDTRPEFYVLHVMQAVRSGDLEEALVSLAFAKVTDLLHVVAFWCRMEWEPTFAARVLFALLRMHQRTIASTRTLRTTMAQIRTDLSATLRRQRDLLGWNVAALSFLDRHRAQAEAARVFIDDGATRRSAPTGTVEGVTQALQTVHIHGSKKATAAAKRKRLIITQ